jgi:hypothetical protein
MAEAIDDVAEQRRWVGIVAIGMDRDDGAVGDFGFEGAPVRRVRQELAGHPGLHYHPMASEGPKSAYELAMERLRQKDRDAGVEERPLTEKQKAAIADARQVYQARVAEREILHQAAVRKAQSREELEKLESELARDRDRLANDRDRKISEIKQQSST